MIKIGVTGTGSLIGQAIIKCIKASSYSEKAKIIGFDYFSNTVGSFWTDENYVLTDIYKNPNEEERWLNEIKEIIKEHEIQFLFIGVDFELALFAKHKESIEAECNVHILVSSEKVIEVGNDKYKTAHFLKENNLYYPETFHFKDCDPEKVNFPVILKPAIGARSRGVSVVNSPKELIHNAAEIDLPVVQEMVGTMDEEYTCGVLCLNGKFIDSIVLKRTLKEGNTSTARYSKSFPPIISDYIRKIAEALQPFGACNFQLRVDSKGIPKMFEINPRHSGTTFMRSEFGYNEIEMILDFFLLNTINKPTLREGIVLRYFEEKFYNR